jgi:class 3 adenylate cyclase
MRGSQRLDVVLGGTLLVTGLLEIAVDRAEFRTTPAVIAVLLGAAALLLRSTRPVLCLAVFVAVTVFTQIPGIADALTASVAVGCLLALGSVGRRSSNPISITAVIATIAIFNIGTVFGSRPLDAVVVLLGCGTAWGAGRVMRRDAQRNIELTELAAFRTILFTDIVESTSLTQRLGDAGVMEMVRAHDKIVRGTLERHRGSEVKHTGDGLMAAFPSIVSAIESAVEIQRRISDAEATGRIPLRVRIGIAAGEPVTERNDLFGATVQLAARLCSRADPGGILVAGAVHDLALGKGFAFRSRGRLRLKGFDSPMPAFEVVWRTIGS